MIGQEIIPENQYDDVGEVIKPVDKHTPHDIRILKLLHQKAEIEEELSKLRFARSIELQHLNISQLNGSQKERDVARTIDPAHVEQSTKSEPHSEDTIMTEAATAVLNLDYHVSDYGTLLDEGSSIVSVSPSPREDSKPQRSKVSRQRSRESRRQRKRRRLSFLAPFMRLHHKRADSEMCTEDAQRTGPDRDAPPHVPGDQNNSPMFPGPGDDRSENVSKKPDRPNTWPSKRFRHSVEFSIQALTRTFERLSTCSIEG